MARQKNAQNGIGKMIGYVRASTSDQLYTLESQAMRIRQQAEIEGVELLDVVIEVESSTKERELLNDVQKRCEDGDAQGIICTNIDRVGRSQFHLASIIRWAEENRIDIMSTEAGWHIKDGKKVDKMLPFRVAMAEVELDNIRERTKRGLAQAKASGKVLGHKVENHELPKVIYDMRSDGLGWRQILKRLEDDGKVTARGCKVGLGNAYNMASRYARENGLALPVGQQG